MTATRIVVLDGSLRPDEGNTARALSRCTAAFDPAVVVDRVALSAYTGTSGQMAARIRAAHGILVGTGTYWGSWGSPLQQFLELMTPWETTDVFFGKPASIVVTMDSTGGAEIAARLAATFVCLGCWLPPLGFMALSRVGVALAEHAPESTRDVWTPADASFIAQNLVVAARAPRPAYAAWPVERAEPQDVPWPPTRKLPPAAPDFL